MHCVPALEVSFLVSIFEIFGNLLGQLLCHWLFSAQHAPNVRPSNPEQLGEFIPTTDCLLESSQIFKRLVHRGGHWVSFLAQSLCSTEEFHQGRICYPSVFSQAGHRVMRNLRFID